METLVLLLAVALLFGFGFWLMYRLDVFLKKSEPRLQWNEEKNDHKKSCEKKRSLFNVH